MTEIEQKAHDLSQLPYHLQLVTETEPDGSQAFLLICVELPGCIAEGSTLEEAVSEFQSVLYEYILVSLEYGAEIPQPYAISEGSYGSPRYFQHIKDFPNNQEQLINVDIPKTLIAESVYEVFVNEQTHAQHPTATDFFENPVVQVA